MRRSLTYYWRMNLAVSAGVAVTTAVLTGALMIGDSMRASLRDLTLDRLGSISHVLLNDRFFDADLAARLASQAEEVFASTDLQPAVLLEGTALHATSGMRASKVQILGVEGRFSNFYAGSEHHAALDFELRPGQIFPPVVLNEPLLTELGAEIGEDIVLSFGRSSDVPTATLMGRRDSSDLLSSLRVTVTATLPASGPGGFSLKARQTRPMTAFLDLSTLQERLDRVGQVNALVAAFGRGSDSRSSATENLTETLDRTLRIQDLGLRLRRGPGYVAVESRELILRPVTAGAVLRLAEELGVGSWPFLTYLANRITVGERLLPYSTVTALPLPIPAPLGSLKTLSGEAVSQLDQDQILLSRWAAEDLAARRGDSLQMSYYIVRDNDELVTATTSFEVAGVVELEGMAADPRLTPDVPGISDADDMASWHPPFPVDLSLIRPQDEAYWDELRGTPKAFVALGTGQDLWRSRFGDLTSVRLLPNPAVDLDHIEDTVSRELPLSLSAERAGFRWLPVREQGLRGASGTTDFAGLFIGFSLFLIVSALLLTTLLFILLIEQRAREAGLLLALGYPVRRVRRRMLAEGLSLAVVGALAGSALAAGYAGLVLKGLETWWKPVVDSPFLQLDIDALTLLAGGGVSVVLTSIVIRYTLRRISRLPIRRLLSGTVDEDSVGKKTRRSVFVARSAGGLTGALLLVALVAGLESAPGLFFGIGATLVAAGIASFSAWAGSTHREETTLKSWVVHRMAARNSARNPGRSLLSVTLVACASFVLVSVNANRKTQGADPLSPASGTGGLTLVAEADTPLPAALPVQLEEMSGSPEAATASAATYFSFRLLPGDDASCLNLYQPERPRLLGAPTSFIQRGGFRFRESMHETDNPWTLLTAPLEDGAIPAIGDYNSVRWILHLGLGRDLTMTTDGGDEIHLRIVGLLDTSIFQSELMISEENFLRHFPGRTGYAYFLGETAAAETNRVALSIERLLAPFGVDAGSTVERLATYQAVEDMYLTTFEILGGLGLVLGTVGLGIVLLRNVLERRGELATLRAFGYRRSKLAGLVVAENAFLLAIGLLIGTISGLIAVAPHLLSGGVSVPWPSLLMTLAAVFGIGLLASVTAVLGSLRVPLLPSLKTD